METACRGAITWLRLGRRLRRRYMITALLGHFRPLVVRFEPRAVVLGFVLWVFEILSTQTATTTHRGYSRFGDGVTAETGRLDNDSVVHAQLLSIARDRRSPPQP